MDISRRLDCIPVTDGTFIIRGHINVSCVPVTDMYMDITRCLVSL